MFPPQLIFHILFHWQKMLLVLWLLAALTTVMCTQGQEQCTSGKIITASIDVHTNETGHTLINGILEQASDKSAWKVDFDLAESRCTSGQAQRKVLTFKVTDMTPRKRVPPGYKLYPGMGYLRGSTVALSWEAARDACGREGAQLATAASQEEAQVLARDFSFDVPNTRVTTYGWYGASDTAEEGTFVTVTGVLLNHSGYGTFRPGVYPNGGTSENCLFIAKNEGFLDDHACSLRFAYICKVPL